ncbi:MAG: hypothetical protein HYY20_13105, partial [Candidatus Tectomicrobia bacterium]|nr:hypothetical protein [Candidatus Tectomicrobia bacterium]
MEDPKESPERCSFSPEGRSGLSRRELLKAATFGAVAAASLGGWGGWSSVMAAPAAPPRRFSAVGRVVHARHPGVMVDPLRPDARIVREMMGRGLQELTGKGSLAQAWGALVTPEDVVGIKLNCTGGQHVSSHPAVVEAIIAGLRGAGVKEENILIWDRHPGRLEAVGYPLNLASKGVRCYPTESEA